MTALTHRYKAWLMLEAETPLSIGSGRESLTTDQLVARSAAGFPYIPGTGLAGALRAALSTQVSKADLENIFGFAKGNKGIGSRLIVNSAHLLSHSGAAVLEGVPQVDESIGYYQHLNTLPERDHVRINECGVAADTGKFDEQLCYKGVRFVCSLELLGTAADKDAAWQQICNQLASPFFRIGGGTRKGFGKIKVVKQLTEEYDLKNADHRNAYLKDDNSLQVPVDAWQEPNLSAPASENYKRYELCLTPCDFFFFGAGFGDDEADDVYKTEKIIDWSSGTAVPSEEKILVPASSVKGALRHRLAFHYNLQSGEAIDENKNAASALLDEKLKELEARAVVPEGMASDDPRWDEIIEALEAMRFETDNKTARKESKADTAAQNKAVRALFGYAADSAANSEEKGQRGNVLFSDVFLPKAKEKIFDHVRIDRFTGGASDGALFQEKTVAEAKSFVLEILVERSALKDEKIESAWHATLSDLCEGRLPLGGKTTKGHGFFTGTSNIDLKKNTNEKAD